MKGTMGIKEVIYLIIGIIIIILALMFFGFFDEIKIGLVDFFRSNSLLESLK